MLPSFGTTASFVRRKYFLCYPAQEISSFGASASFIWHNCFLRSAQVLPLLSGARDFFVRHKCFLRLAQVLPLVSGARDFFVRRKCFLRSAQVLPSFGASASFVRRKCFLLSAQVLPSFGASASFVRHKYFFRSAQALPLLSGARDFFVRCKCFFRSAQALPLLSGARDFFVRCKCFLRISDTTLYFYLSPTSFKFFAPTTSLPPKLLTHTTVSSFTTSSLQCHHFWARKIKPPSERGVGSFFCTSHIPFLPLFAHPSCRLPTWLQDRRFRSRVRWRAHYHDECDLHLTLNPNSPLRRPSQQARGRAQRRTASSGAKRVGKHRTLLLEPEISLIQSR